ncbi:MAG: Na+/H+ antiporter subunit E [Lachnospiraceae bacterium]|nr:Na+/H+ antiporter subunit E [Lachnospiraceae bacterium]
MYLLFFLFWVIFNGQLTLEIGIIGIFVAALLYAFICKFMGWSPKKDLLLMQYTGFMFCYLFVLIWEIIKANMDTVKMIFTSRYEREPVLVTFHTALKSPVLRVILANSITLTPGTITVSLEGDTFVVHALDKDFVEGIEDSVFVRWLLKAERIGQKDE